MSRSRLLTCALLLVSTTGGLTAAAQQPTARAARVPPRAEVLVLGVYHMSNPGRDVFNTEADDVLAPRRQAEIAELVEVLRRFRPTKIAVEEDFNSRTIDERYQDYLDGTHELTRNETEQIGFRLAGQLGHEAVYPVDAGGEFPVFRVMDYVKAHDQADERQALMDEIGADVQAEQEYMGTHSVLEILLRMNADAAVARDVGYYYREVQFGEPWDWAGADLVASWFRRNLRIFSNIVDLVDSPNERVLAIFGAGHLGWLRQCIEGDPELRLRKLEELVE